MPPPARWMRYTRPSARACPCDVRRREKRPNKPVKGPIKILESHAAASLGEHRFQPAIQFARRFQTPFGYRLIQLRMLDHITRQCLAIRVARPSVVDGIGN